MTATSKRRRERPDLPPKLHPVGRDVSPTSQALHLLTVGLRNSASAWWGAEVFGEFDEPWPAGETAHVVRLAYLVALMNRHLTIVSDGRWSMQLDNPDDPSLLLMQRKGGFGTLPVFVHGDVLTVGVAKLKLTERGTTLRALDHLTRKIARHFVVGRPARVS